MAQNVAKAKVSADRRKCPRCGSSLFHIEQHGTVVCWKRRTCGRVIGRLEDDKNK